MQLVVRDPNVGYIDTHLHIPKSAVNVEGVKNTLTFEIFDQEEARLLVLYEESGTHMMVPRAMWDLSTFPTVPFVDLRPTGFHRTGIKSRIKLDHRRVDGRLQPTGKTIQRDAIQALQDGQGGTLQLKCGAGKTVVALEFATRRQVPTLVALDNTHLLHQWQEQVADLLDVPGGTGLIQADVRDWQHGLVFATYHTLANWAETMPEEVRRWFGLVIFDEGHHVNAPTFSRAAGLFYGYRLSLTATPTRSDGSHVVTQYHVGSVIFKDIKQEMPPAISFRWTGLQLDLEDLRVRAAVHDMNGELHLGKLAVYFGGWRKRLTEVLLPMGKEAVAQGRKVLMLSNSVNEVINLMTLWTRGPNTPLLYTDIPQPTPQDIGETLDPVELKTRSLNNTKTLLSEIRRNLKANRDLTNVKREQYEHKAQDLETKLEQHRIFKKLEGLYKKRQRDFLRDLLTESSTAGLFTHGVEPEERMKMLRGRKIIFAIMKYGKEGLDDRDLDTVIMCEPVSDRNTIQQIMGRPRDKKNGTLTIVEDNIPPIIAQCQQLRQHFKQWAVDEGGPFRYELLGHPAMFRRRGMREHIRINT